MNLTWRAGNSLGGLSLSGHWSTVAGVAGLVGLYVVEFRGLWRLPSDFWGMYGNTDGMWAAWNAQALFQWSRPFDLSPFNPLAGMGSLFLPNLPWLNPGALSLGLPIITDLRYLVSYTTCFIELAVTQVILMRALGFGLLQSLVGAQLYLFMLFPPSSGILGALSWLSLAPVNAHLASVANVALALIVIGGRLSTTRNVGCAVAFGAA